MIESYELAFRMQGELPKVHGPQPRIGRDAEAVRHRRPAAAVVGRRRVRRRGDGTGGFGRQCLLARRFVEAGVRFVEITLRRLGPPPQPQGRARPNSCTRHRQADRRAAARPEAARPAGGHAGASGAASSAAPRTPRAPTAATTTTRATPSGWPAAASRAGFAYGATDDYGYEAVEDKVHVHDWHATILHLLGLDHERLTYRYAGRDMRLTDVKGERGEGNASALTATRNTFTRSIWYSKLVSY